jgi:hypothetical protein
MVSQLTVFTPVMAKPVVGGAVVVEVGGVTVVEVGGATVVEVGALIVSPKLVVACRLPGSVAVKVKVL